MGIKKNDTVMILTGKAKGKQGKVLSVDYKNGRITVEGINLVKKAVRKSQQYPQGGIIDYEAPVNITNANILCPKCNKKTRIAKKILDNGNHVRICRRCNEIIDKV
ncbi:MAG: 50S ribosomal protein L24 [Spirochaetes bacterium]|nr:50S ribosomal protein L24 [Spirochaetota bacterium]